MTTHADRWLATEQVAQRLGMSSEWVRRQIVAGRLHAVAYETGARRTYRVRESWVRQYLAAFQITHFDDR